MIAKSPLIPLTTPFIAAQRRGISRPIFVWGTLIKPKKWVISSAVEHFVDIEGVTSSILVPPTMFTDPRLQGPGSLRESGARRAAKKEKADEGS